jgi:transposase
MGKRGKKKMVLSNEDFQKVVSLVGENMSIYEAVKIIGFNRQTFYNLLTEKQKVELKMTKTLNTILGRKYYN